MRELKFRGWSIDGGKWCSRVDYDGYKEKWTGIVEVNSPIEKDKYIGEYAAEPEEIIIEQYTGIKDKNGEEIYEGDIVKVDKLFDAIVVGYDAGGFVLHNEDWDCVVPMSRNKDDVLGVGLGDKCTTVEVIGNIHENQELLEGNNGEEE